MLKKGVWRSTASEAVLLHQDQALSTTILLLRTYGPTGFLLREEIHNTNYKVFLGDHHCCTCPVYEREQEPCKHICWLLLKKFRLPREHEYSFQVGLSERQMSELLEGSHQTRPRPSADVCEVPALPESGGVVQKPIYSQDVCPICQEELLEKRLPVCYCRFSCGNSVHLSCMKVWAEHQKRLDPGEMVRCPLCREDFCSVKSLWTQIENVHRLYTLSERGRHDTHYGLSCQSCGVCPIIGNCFRCTVCSHVYFCQTCSKRGCHPLHQFAFRSKRKEEWRLVSEGASGATSVIYNPPVEPLPDSVLARFWPVVRVRSGSQLLDEGLQCRLCLLSFTLGQRVRSLPCHHKFHADCIDGILRTSSSCPIDGYFIYNPMSSTCKKKTPPKITPPNSKPSIDHSYKDLFIPGVALQDKKPTHSQLKVHTNYSQHPKSTDTTNLGKNVKKLPAISPNLEHIGLYVGVMEPKQEVKVTVCKRMKLPTQTRKAKEHAVPSELTMTGVVLGSQRKSET